MASDKQISQLTAASIGSNNDCFMFDDAEGYTYKINYSALASAILQTSLGAGVGISITQDTSASVFKMNIASTVEGSRWYYGTSRPQNAGNGDYWIDTTSGQNLSVYQYNGSTWVDTGMDLKGADGTNGQDGQDGQDGADGYSISATTTTITGGHRVTIHSTDPNVPDTYFDVMDGSGGGGGGSDVNVYINAVRRSGSWNTGSSSINTGGTTMYITPEQNLNRFSHYWTGEGASLYPYGLWQWIAAVTATGIYWNLVNNDGHIDCIKVGDVALIAENGYMWYMSTWDGTEVWAQIMGIDTYTGYGDTPIGHHIDWRFIDLWDLGIGVGSISYVNYNNGFYKAHASFTGDGVKTQFDFGGARGPEWIGEDADVYIDNVLVPTSEYTLSAGYARLTFNTAPANGADIKVEQTGSKCPWLTTDLYYYLNQRKGITPDSTSYSETIYDYVDYTVEESSPWEGANYYCYFSGAVIEKRILLPQRWASGSLVDEDNGWEWVDIGKLWLPSESEIFGFPIWGSNNSYTKGCTAIQYPLFVSTMNRVMYRSGNRHEYCLINPSAGSSSDWTYVDENGVANGDLATTSPTCIPICFRTGETFTINPYWD